MKISYKHLSRTLSGSVPINEISKKLFQLGHEHEIDGKIFDIEFTPNRGDCLSLLGLSRDLEVFYERNENFITIYKDEIKPLNFNFTNHAQEHCPNISFLKIEIDEIISPYKDYLNDYFEDLKISKNNFFTDISNYVSYEMGQPTHCYDYEKIDNNLNLELSTENTEFNAITGQKINIDEGELVFKSNNKVVNLAGVMGGKNTSCSENTKNVLVECAYFQPETIIGTSLKYNLQSDAAYKFERGTDYNCHEKVLRRFIKIVSEHANINKLELVTYCSKANEEKKINCSVEKINSILGINITEYQYKEFLNRLGFDVDSHVIKPSYRNDIENDNDLAEEIARIIGYNNIPINKFEIKNFNKNQKNNTKEEFIKKFLVDNGFAETVNSSFSAYYDPQSIKVDNPIDKNRAAMRVNIIDSLIENVIYNENRQNDSIKLFEISDIYIQNKDLQKEKMLGIVVSGRQGHNYVDFGKKLDSDYLLNLLGPLFTDASNYLQKIDRNNVDSKIKTPIFGFEIPLKCLIDDFPLHTIQSHTVNNFVKYKPISEYPSSYRDLSISIRNFDIVNEVLDSLNNFQSDILKDSFMFDFFDNKKNCEIKIGYRFIFQSSSLTLKDADIDSEINKILEIIKSFDSVEIPGLT